MDSRSSAIQRKKHCGNFCCSWNSAWIKYEIVDAYKLISVALGHICDNEVWCLINMYITYSVCASSVYYNMRQLFQIWNTHMYVVRWGRRKAEKAHAKKNKNKKQRRRSGKRKTSVDDGDNVDGSWDVFNIKTAEKTTKQKTIINMINTIEMKQLRFANKKCVPTTRFSTLV